MTTKRQLQVNCMLNNEMFLLLEELYSRLIYNNQSFESKNLSTAKKLKILLKEVEEITRGINDNT